MDGDTGTNGVNAYSNYNTDYSSEKTPDAAQYNIVQGHSEDKGDAE